MKQLKGPSATALAKQGKSTEKTPQQIANEKAASERGVAAHARHEIAVAKYKNKPAVLVMQKYNSELIKSVLLAIIVIVLVKLGLRI